jgi:predicted nuclease of predicted toxin-antitoxin system
VKFLIDECLSPDLAKLARERGYTESGHVRRLGLAGAKDHVVTRRAVDDGYVLVTHNTTDFRGLYSREDLHVGLVTFNTAPGLMNLDLQVRLFLLALAELEGEESWNEALEITVDADRTVTIERFDLPG